MALVLKTRVVQATLGSNPRLSAKWPHRQVVKTPPFHGGLVGSNPAGVTITYRGVEQG